jgi:aspartate racemase
LHKKIVCLPTTALEIVNSTPGKFLVACTTASARVNLFKRHTLWERVKGRLVFPDEQDQGLVHRLLYRIKANDVSRPDVSLLAEMSARYGCDGVLAGCTEVHLIADYLEVTADRSLRLLDPLSVIAGDIRGYIERAGVSFT